MTTHRATCGTRAGIVAHRAAAEPLCLACREREATLRLELEGIPQGFPRPPPQPPQPDQPDQDDQPDQGHEEDPDGDP